MAGHVQLKFVMRECSKTLIHLTRHIWCNVNFVYVFTALNNTNKQRKFNITPYGEHFLLVNLLEKKIKSGLHFLKVFFH